MILPGHVFVASYIYNWPIISQSVSRFKTRNNRVWSYPTCKNTKPVADSQFQEGGTAERFSKGDVFVSKNTFY